MRTLPGVTRICADDAVPVRRWQRVQWQYSAVTGGSVSSKRTAPQPQPPLRWGIVLSVSVPRVPVVTGAASGIGRATAAALTEAGLRVVGADVAPGEGVAELDVTDA